MSDRLHELIEPVVSGLGCELWGIELNAHGKHAFLKIYIDAEDGINVDDCARVSSQVSSVLDVEDPISGEYTLEVSSPGLDRRLFRLEHYAAFAGSDVKISLKRPYEGSRKYKGRLQGIEGDEVVLYKDGEEFLFPFEEIDKANVVPDFSASGGAKQ